MNLGCNADERFWEFGNEYLPELERCADWDELSGASKCACALNTPSDMADCVIDSNMSQLFGLKSECGDGNNVITRYIFMEAFFLKIKSFTGCKNTCCRKKQFGWESFVKIKSKPYIFFELYQ